jgi:crotonobetainyl-CoA:carnitine CoA-transferase CaiB-like acyl-CoA transferase
MGDGIAGMFGALGIAAEIARLRADPAAQGAEIDLSATEAMLRFLEPLAVEYEQLGVARARNGNQATYTAPSNMYRSLDGVWFTMVASSNPIFARLMTAIGQAELATSPMFVNTSARLRNVDTLDRIIGGWFAAHDAMQIEHALEAAVVPHGRVASIAEVVEDPQVIARGSLVRLPDDDLGSIPAPAAVPRFPDRVWQVPRTGPAVGQHNAEIYGTLGLDELDLATLRADGIV